MNESVRIERLIDLPRPIVEDALVDPVLLEGWLHPTHLLGDFPGVTVSVAEVPGGTRGSSTVVTVEIAIPDPRFRPGYGPGLGGAAGPLGGSPARAPCRLARWS